jgi:hypothetical protein
MALGKFMEAGFPEPDMLLESVCLPLSTNQNQIFKSYRVASRELGNALAFINAAFLVTTESHSSGRYSEWSIVAMKMAFGALGGAHAIRAHAVEDYLTGKKIDANVLMEAIGILKNELSVPLKHVKKNLYRSSVSVSLFFEFFRHLLPPRIQNDDALTWNILDNMREEAKQPDPVRTFQSSKMSNGDSIPKKVLDDDFNVAGKQIVPIYEDDDFIGEPIQKTEAAIQASGLGLHCYEKIPGLASNTRQAVLQHFVHYVLSV